jgi:hypothetical protein
MKYAFLILLSVLGLTAVADSEIMRPGDRYVYIGEFDSNKPFGWDEDTIISNVRDWTDGVVFDVRRGIDIEINDITIVCSRGNVCDRMRGGVVGERRPMRIPFRRNLDVAQVIVRSRPRGFSVPPTRVDVYLETRRGWP